MNIITKLLVASCALFALSQAHSHAMTEPQHGGVLTTSGDWTFELVDTEKGVMVYLFDDTVPYDTTGMKGKLKVDDGSVIDVSLMPAGDHSLVAEDVDIPSGSKVLIVVTLADGYTKVGGKLTTN